MASQEATSPTCKCPEPSTGSRNLVVCIDGTSKQFGPKNTNIVELYSHITKSDQQLTYYCSGLGTVARAAGASWRHQLSGGWDMVLGSNLEKVIMASYRWLSDNYQNGDRVFLFGFSRGAYQVRALAGMIARVGLLLPGNNEQIPFAFDLYSKTNDEGSSLTRPASVISQPMTTKESEKKAKYSVLANTFKRTFCRSDVQIHFVGVWDTVSSVGMRRGKTLPGTTSSCEHICYFRHALALDERRVKFLPEYVYGGRSGVDGERIKEVWFAGCHADVGGGNRQNEKLQSGDIPLLWMRSQAIAAGLGMEPVDVMWKIDDLNKHINPSLKHVWWLLELMPLRHLLYYNSDRGTSSPHLGQPRRILPGQKVHVSVLFKNNYKPCAQFYNNPTGWPEPMFWNDATSHLRLQDLPDMWEKDIFDDGFLPTLFNDLKRGQSILDALDRLAFLASFDVYKTAINDYPNARQILAAFLKSEDTSKVVRLSTAATYCELRWDWPSGMPTDDLEQRIVNDVSELLKSDKDCRRACIYIPSLCKRAELKAGLINDTNLKTLVQFCDTTRIAVKHGEGTSTVAFHSAQALSMLMKLDNEFAKKLIEIDLVTDIIEALRSNCNPVLVAVLNVVDGMAKDEYGRATMRTGPIIPTLVRLMKQFDDFVAPAATRVLCSLLPEDDLRELMVLFGVLSAFMDMLDRCSDETKQVACDALVKFVRYDDIQRALFQDGYLEKLAKRAQSHLPSKRDGAIIALVTLGSTPVRKGVMEAIQVMNTIPVLVGQLRKGSTALCAATTLARLVRINNVAVMVSQETSGASAAIVDMLRNRWFDGLRGEDGLQVLFELLKCEGLRSAVLKAGAIAVLRHMIEPGHYKNTYAALHYLWIVGQFSYDDGQCMLSNQDTESLAVPVVHALRAPQRRVQRTAMAILALLSKQEHLRMTIVDGLVELLNDRHAGVLLAACTVLGYLARDAPVRDRVLEGKTFWDLSHEYYDGLRLEPDDMGRGPDAGDVYKSVGDLIKRMQPDTDEVGGDPRSVVEENKWLVRMPYEPTKEKRWDAYLMRTLL